MAETREIYLAGGCFWGMQAYLDKLPGVIETVVGYANGTTEAPTYEEVCSGTTHHAETVHVTYDPKVIGLPLLLARGGVPPEVPGQGPLRLLPRRPGRRRPLCGRAPGGVRPGRVAR